MSATDDKFCNDGWCDGLCTIDSCQEANQYPAHIIQKAREVFPKNRELQLAFIRGSMWTIKFSLEHTKDLQPWYASELNDLYNGRITVSELKPRTLEYCVRNQIDIFEK